MSSYDDTNLERQHTPQAPRGEWVRLCDALVHSTNQRPSYLFRAQITNNGDVLSFWCKFLRYFRYFR